MLQSGVHFLSIFINIYVICKLNYIGKHISAPIKCKLILVCKINFDYYDSSLIGGEIHWALNLLASARMITILFISMTNKSWVIITLFVILYLLNY